MEQTANEDGEFSAKIRHYFKSHASAKYNILGLRK